MNDRKTNPMPELGESEVRRLIESAGPRPEVPAAELAAIKAAAHEDWRRLVDVPGAEPGASGRNLWRTAVPLALAATLLLALSLGLWWRGLQGTGAGAALATVERLDGDVRVGDTALTVGRELESQAVVETAAGSESPARVTMRLSGGQSVRLDVGSRLRLASATSLELERGAVYIDSGGDGSSLEVRTALGSVRDIGTQFEVRLDEGRGSLRVRVREGSVEVERGEELHSAVAGEELTVGVDGSTSRQALTPFDSGWDWVVAMAPGLEGEILTLGAYFEWLARETGWHIRFSDQALADSLSKESVYGDSVRGLAPDQSIHVVLPGSNLEYRLEEGVLLIEP